MTFHFPLAFPEHMSSPLTFSGIRVAQSLVFYVALGISCVLFSFFLRPLHCLPCLFTASDYSTDIFKLFIVFKEQNKYDTEKLTCVYMKTYIGH